MPDGDDIITPFRSHTFVFDTYLPSFLSITKMGSVRDIVSNEAIVQTMVFPLFIIFVEAVRDLHALGFRSL